MAGTATAQDYGQARTLKIWDNKTAPHGNGIATPEREPEKNRLTDVSEAVLYIFPAAPEKAAGRRNLPRRRLRKAVHRLRRL